MARSDITSDENWFVKHLGFNRGLIRRSEKFIEQDFKGVHPRELLRKTRRKIQDISREKDKFKFKIKADPIEVSEETVGEGSGYVRGGLKAHYERPDHDGGLIKYKPYQSKGLKGILAGSALLAVGLISEPLIAIPGIALAGVGVYAYRYSEYETFNIQIVSKLRSMILGEVTEEKTKKDGKTETSVKGNVSMMFAADTDVELLTLHEYKSVLDKPDVKNTDALVNKIESLKDEVYRDIYLDHWEDIQKPIPKKKVKKKGYQVLKDELEKEYPKEQIKRWVTQKLKSKSVVEDHVIDQAEDDLRVVKNEAVDLSARIADYVEE